MIEVRDLHVTLGRRPILRGISLEVRRGDAVALVGPNGAGKTTAIRAIAGLVRYEGAIAIGGVDVTRDPVRAKAGLGFMPQVPAFLEETPRGALAFVAAVRGSSRREVEPLLDRVGLLAHARRRIADLSTGMRQRLSLAAALVGDPDVLLLDEPTASLDLRGQEEFIALFRGLEAEGKTVLLSSHRPEEVRALARRVVALDDGRVVEERARPKLVPSEEDGYLVASSEQRIRTGNWELGTENGGFPAPSSPFPVPRSNYLSNPDDRPEECRKGGEQEELPGLLHSCTPQRKVAS